MTMLLEVRAAKRWAGSFQCNRFSRVFQVIHAFTMREESKRERERESREKEQRETRLFV